MTTKTLLAAACLCAALPAQLHWTDRSNVPRPAPSAQGTMAATSNPTDLLYFSGSADPQTWRYAAGSWTRLTPRNQPPGDAEAKMVYDPIRDEVVLVNGISRPDPTAFPFIDLWTWDGSNWTRRTPANRPAVRGGFDLAFVEQTGEIVLFGGVGGSGQTLADTWVWNGTDWRALRTGNSPSPRAFHAMCTAPGLGAMLHAGRDAFGELDDTWVFDGSDWRRLVTAEAPPPRREHSLTYDSDRQRYVVHGGRFGFDVRADTWEFGDQGWRAITVGQPGPRVASHAADYDPTDLEVLVVGGAVPGTAGNGPSDQCATLAPTIRASIRQVGGPGCGSLLPVRFLQKPILGTRGFDISVGVPVLNQTVPFVALYSGGLRQDPLRLGECTLYLDGPLITSMPTAFPRFTLSIPEDPALRGAVLFTQILGQERRVGGGYLGVGFTEAFELTLGD